MILGYKHIQSNLASKKTTKTRSTIPSNQKKRQQTTLASTKNTITRYWKTIQYCKIKYFLYSLGSQAPGHWTHQTEGSTTGLLCLQKLGVKVHKVRTEGSTAGHSCLQKLGVKVHKVRRQRGLNNRPLRKKFKYSCNRKCSAILFLQTKKVNY